MCSRAAACAEKYFEHCASHSRCAVTVLLKRLVQWLQSQFHDICSRISCQLAGVLAESIQKLLHKACWHVEQKTSSKDNAPAKMALAVLATK